MALKSNHCYQRDG